MLGDNSALCQSFLLRLDHEEKGAPNSVLTGWSYFFLNRYIQMGVSTNNGTSKWMVYNGKPYEQMEIWGVKPLFLG